MSVNLDPSDHQTPINVSTQNKSKGSLIQQFAQNWLSLIQEGLDMERMSASEYCIQKLNKQSVKSDEVAASEMQTCMQDCEFYKTLARWHRRI